MNRNLFVLTGVIVVIALVLAACAPAATPAPTTEAPPPTVSETQAPTEAATAAPTEAPVVEKTALIGFTASLTGSLNVESIRQKNGLDLWVKQVNDAGGIKLNDGSVVKFTTKFYDDESNKDRVQELYTRLATEDNANFLISPYSSGLADASAVIAEQYGKIMITTGAAADSTYKKGYTLVYQTYTPSSRYLTGSLDLLASLDPEAKNIAIVHENDKFSTTVVEALKPYAESKGYNIVLYEGYDSGTTDFNPIINKIAEAKPDAIMGGGHFQDGSTLTKQLFEKKLESIKFFSLLVAPPEPKFAELGDAAIGVVGPSQWEPLAAFKAEYGISGEQFVSDYKAAYNENPSYHSAGGYIAGLILQMGIEASGTLDTKAVAAAIDAIDVTTFYGHIKFDTSPENHGLQIGHEMVYVQWQKDASGNLVKQVVWPADAVTAVPIYPIR